MKNQKLTDSVRWTARISGSLLLAFGLFFLLANIFGQDELGGGIRDSKEMVIFLLFPMSTILGLALAWKWEGLGGIITTAGMIWFFILRPELISNFYMVIPIIPGLLFIAYWLMAKNKMSNKTRLNKV